MGPMLVTAGALALFAVAVVVALTIDRHIPGRQPLGLHAGRRAGSVRRRWHLSRPVVAEEMPPEELPADEALAELERRLTELEQLAAASPADHFAERLAQLEERLAKLESREQD
jgi:hypothetical protein